MNKFFKTLSIILLITFVSVSVLIYFLPTPPLLNDLGFSRVVYDKNGHLLRLTLSSDDKYRVFTPLSDMAPEFITATLLQEDQYFYNHAGINPFAMIKAGFQTYIKHSRRMGASTITMQVARLRYNINSKKLSGKIKQIIRALQLEMHYSKNDILEAYLNLAPYGGNIEGVGAASLIYFNKQARNASLPDILALSVIPQNPTKRIAQDKYLAKARVRLFKRWLSEHPNDNNLQPAINLPLVMQRAPALPFFAPHFVNEILSNASINDKSINTTIDLPLQKILERITRNYLNRKNNIGAFNASVLVVDSRDMSITGLIGSANFFEQSISGQINGTNTKRSPGSTLKPFIYALALDQGLIHPNTVLKDVPRSFGSYNPENFDYDFVGPIKAKDALVLSRNIPAIALANQLSNTNNLYHLLEQTQVSQLKPESYYGLALTLGGAELTMKELGSLYAMLLNDGIWHPLRGRVNEPTTQGKRLLSPEASFLVLDMLKDTPRPDSFYQPDKFPVSWKTGTSSGYRDAWTVGTFGPYVLAVWIGNFNNKSNPAFIGKNLAAPLFFELAEGIKYEHGLIPAIQQNPLNMNLARIEVCKASGMLPTRYCDDTEMTWFIPGKSPIKSDTIYREVAINDKTGLRTCHIDENTRFEVYEFWPSDLLKIFKQAGIQRRIPPFYEPNCPLASGNSLSPQITSPQTEVSYIVRANASQSAKIPLTAVVDADVRLLYWFINNTYLAKTRRDQPLIWQAKPGKFVIRVVDDHGLSDARDINVKVDN